MKILKLISMSVLIVFTLCPSVLSGQQVQSKIRIIPQRAAEGQTKWMMSLLKINQDLYSPLYDINLKYQIKGDSIHLSTMAYADKRKLYSFYSKKKYDELRKILPRKSYDRYVFIIDSIKSQQPRK